MLTLSTGGHRWLSPSYHLLMAKHFYKAEYMHEAKTLGLLTPMPLQCIAIMVAAVSPFVAHPAALTRCVDSICFGSFC
jgi:hypothetical protein